jgi:hypothetical protein
LFDRPHHRRVAHVLGALDAPLLAAQGCLFGGGTAIALTHGEYRESVDIDFLVSQVAGYRELRRRLTAEAGIQAIVRPGAALAQTRELRADQYGIRTIVEVDNASIKFEIVLEARIALDPPGTDDSVCGIATLTPRDMVASKLLANCDRWADDSVFCRDLIDLAMMKPTTRLLQQGLDKARLAYGDSVDKDLARAIERLLERQGRLEQCMKAMQMTVPPALLRQNIKRLAPRPAART